MYVCMYVRHTIAQVVEALPYRREGSRVRFTVVSLEFLNRHYHSGRTMALGSTQPLTEMSTRNISWEVKAAGA